MKLIIGTQMSPALVGGCEKWMNIGSTDEMVWKIEKHSVSSPLSLHNNIMMMQSFVVDYGE